jgi:hypothetical protein
MSAALASPAPPSRTTTRRNPAETARRRRPCLRAERLARGDERRLDGYLDPDGRAREVIARLAAGGSTLVIDRRCADRADERLVAHLACDEPPENASLVCRCYLLDLAERECACRALDAADESVVPFAEHAELAAGAAELARVSFPVDPRGRLYTLERLRDRLSIPELRWCRRAREDSRAPEAVSLREAIASLESYEPVRTLTLHALAAAHDESQLSTTVLRAELARVQSSPIVLNRGLREAVLAAVAEGLSMSEIAIRCGRIKRDRRGNQAGETSWLARRLGLAPEAGQARPTPWIHSDVLALIARDGLGVSPREVEL